MYRMAESDKFQKWARIEACRVTGKLAEIEEKIDYDMKYNIRVEKKEDGKWMEWNEKG